MTFRDAWESVKGTSKEAAQKAYVDKFLEVRFISNILLSHHGMIPSLRITTHFVFVLPPCFDVQALYVRETRTGLFGDVSRGGARAPSS